MTVDSAIASLAANTTDDISLISGADLGELD
jgi:hypothetical protein